MSGLAIAIGLALASPGPGRISAISVQARSSAPDREIWFVDQLRLPPDTPQSVLTALGPDHSMADVIKRLKALGVPFTRQRLTITPDRLSPRMRELVTSLPPGEPIVSTEPGFIGVTVLLGRRLPADTVRFVPAPARSVARQEA